MFSSKLFQLAGLVVAGHRQAAFPLLETALLEQALPCLPPEAAPIMASDVVSGTGSSDTGLPDAVPARLVQYWHSPDRPADVALSIERLRARNPGLAFEIVDDELARSFIGQHFDADMMAAFEGCFHNAMKSDLYRMCDLFVRGGVYLDVDIHCFGSLAPIFAGAAFGCFMLHAVGSPYCIENGLIAAAPGNAMVGDILRGMQRNLLLFRNQGAFENVWTCTGPGITTETIMLGFAEHVLGRSDRFATSGFLTACNTRSAVSYGHDELEYKATADGNWRRAVVPTRV